VKTLKKFLHENTVIKLRGFGGTTHFKHEATGSKGEVWGGPDQKAYVTGIETHPEHRRKGGAHNVMKQITNHLDDRNQTAWLKAHPTDPHTTVGQLHKFYKKHGFKGPAERMVRTPKS
jgi:ribosomal protein S18 acetylase RimI-like enzyme